MLDRLQPVFEDDNFIIRKINRAARPMNKDTGIAAVKVQDTALAYLAMARLDHSTKHIFIVPGIMLAYLLRGVHTDFLVAFPSRSA